MGAGLARLVIALTLGRSRIVMTDNGCLQGIGSGNDGRPASRDRREDLHRQGEQDDRKTRIQEQIDSLFPKDPAYELRPVRRKPPPPEE